MTDRKVHIRANKPVEGKADRAICASVHNAVTGTVRFNSRASYRYMASEIVSMREAAAMEPAKLCAHCVEAALDFRNAMRKARGLPPVADWRAYTPK